MILILTIVTGLIAGRLVLWIANRISERFELMREQSIKNSSLDNSWSEREQVSCNNLLPENELHKIPNKVRTNVFLTELVTGALFGALFLRFGLSWSFAVYCLFFFALISIFIIDLKMMVIPDLISLSALVIGFGASFLGILPGVNWTASLAGIIFGIAILYVPAKIYEVAKGSSGLGGGDVKLLAMIGSFVSVQGVIFTLFLGALTGLLVSTAKILLSKSGSKDPIPFGPYLASAAIFYVLEGSGLIANLLTNKVLFF
ncbi:MAG: A24 family peptidase [Desulfomonilaceae bacterium]